jgi:putative ABC transport system permease protein
MIKDTLKYSIASLWNRKTRSFLTMLSILIGIAAILSLSSFGIGINYFVKDFAKKAGTDKILMMPKDALSSPGNTKNGFTTNELDYLKKLNGVDEGTGIIMSNAKVKYRDYKEKYTFAFGMPSDPKEMKLAGETFGILDIEKGRSLKKGDLLKVVLGYNYLIPDKLFKRAVSVGDKIKINNIDVQVIGFYKEIGNPQDDAQIYMTAEGSKEIFKKDTYEYAILRSAADQNARDLADKIKEKFRKHRGQEKDQEDFIVQTFEQVMETYSSILNVIIGIVVLIALISVIVAAVNIMNTMYTSILERTQEIGVMKSIGATNRLILFIFIVESGFLSALGGLIGIGLGYVIAKIGGAIAAYYGLSLLKPIFPLWLVLGCFIFSFLVGSVAGLIPAFQASRLKPVDALRYE